MPRFKIKFTQVENGWVQVFFYVGAQEYEFWFSHVVYEAALAWLCEASQECEMRFSKTGGSVRFEMWRFESHQCDIAKPHELQILVSGTYDEICLPF